MPTSPRWQISLRTLLLLVVPLAIGLGVTRLARAAQLWLALGASLGYFGSFLAIGAGVGYTIRRREGAVDGAIVGLSIATLIFFTLTLAGW